MLLHASEPAPPTPAEHDTAALLEAVGSFAGHEIASRRPRPEQALLPADFDAIAEAAEHAGLLDPSAEGYGLWSDLASVGARGRASGPAFTLAALERLSAEDCAAAWHLHGLSLASAASQLAGLAPAPRGVFSLDGAQGIGRSALGRFLSGRALLPSDRAILADGFGLQARIALVAPGASRLLALAWRGDGFGLEAHELSLATLRRDELPHGLDGCAAVRWLAGAQPLASAPLATAAVGALIGAQQLAQVAIARGAAGRARRLAHDHAALRYQGARRIVMHDAVALLLADIDSACSSVDALLRDAGRRAIDARAAIAIRREAMPLLCRAVNAAMQVHGGVGYMRDVGVERLFRDVNTMRVVGGSPAELGLVCAGLEAEQAALPEDEAGAGDHLPGHLPASHPLSPTAAFRRVPLLRRLAAPTPADPWEVDTRSLPRPLADLRRAVRRFAERECAPLAAAVDRERLSGHELTPPLRALIGRAGRAGLLTDTLPVPLGSMPLARLTSSLALQQAVRVEELSRVDGGLMLLLSAHSLGVCPLLLSGDLALIRRVLLPAFRAAHAGEPEIFAFAITEPGAGSDAEEGHGALHQRAGASARRAQGGWLLRGRKVFISGGDIARWVTVFAALEGEGYESWTCFLVDTRSPGFRVVRAELKMGMRASGAAELEFDDCFVPDSMVVGGVRNGWALSRATLNLSRLPVAAMGVGFAQQAVDIATRFACQSTLAGRPLVHYRHVQATLADLQAETGAIRALVWHHARAWRPRQDGAALCKFQATDRAQAVIEAAMDLLGSAAPLHEQRLERALRDVRLTRIFEGTNQINRLAVIEDQQRLLLDRIAEAR